MEFANLSQPDVSIRIAEERDTPTIYNLLEKARYRHVHVDWYLPVDWLGQPGFVVAEKDGVVIGCLAAGADPPPAAWMRVVALEEGLLEPLLRRERERSLGIVQRMLDVVVPVLEAQGVSELAWMAARRWPSDWLQRLGFVREHAIQTYVKEGLELPAGVGHTAVGLTIRPVEPQDMGRLAALEAAAFDPLWRHTARGLELGLGQATSFDVALRDGEIVGFQHSVAGDEGGVHLARITIDPRIQGRKVGTTLLAHTMGQYVQQGYRYVTLNTQVDNHVSQRLYARFGFRAYGPQIPVWSRHLTPRGEWGVEEETAVREP